MTSDDSADPISNQIKRRKYYREEEEEEEEEYLMMIRMDESETKSRFLAPPCDTEKQTIANDGVESRAIKRPSRQEKLIRIFIFAYLIAHFSHQQVKLAEAGSKSSKASSKTTVIAIDGGGGGKPHPVPIPWPIVHCHHHHHHLKYVPKPVLVHHWVKKLKPYEIAASAENQEVSMLPPPPSLSSSSATSMQQSFNTQPLEYGGQMSPQTQYQVFGPGNELSLSSSDTSKLPYEVMNTFDDGHPLMSGSQQPRYTHFKTSFSSLPASASLPSAGSSSVSAPGMPTSAGGEDRQFKKVYEKRHHAARPQVSQKQLEKISQTILANASAAQKQKAAGKHSTANDEDLNASIKNIALANKTLEAGGLVADKATGDELDEQSAAAAGDVNEASYSANVDLNRANSKSARPSHPFNGNDDLVDQYKDESTRTFYTLPIDKLNSKEESEAMRMFERLSLDQSSRLSALNVANQPQFYMQQSQFLRQPEVGFQQQPPQVAAAAAAATITKLLSSPLAAPAISARVAGAMSESHTIELMTKLAEQMAQVEARKLISRQQQRATMLLNNGTQTGGSGQRGKFVGGEQPQAVARQSFIQKVNPFNKLGASLKFEKDKRRISQSHGDLLMAAAASAPITSFRLPMSKSMAAATGGPMSNLQQQQLNQLSRAASSRFMSDPIVTGSRPIAPVPLNLGAKSHVTPRGLANNINNNNNINSVKSQLSLAAQPSNRVNEFVAAGPSGNTNSSIMSSEQENSFYSGQQEHLAKIMQQQLAAAPTTGGQVSVQMAAPWADSRFGGQALAGPPAYRAQASNVHDSVVRPNEPLASSSNATINEQQQQQYETSSSPQDATGSQYMMTQPPQMNDIGQQHQLFQQSPGGQTPNWNDFARYQATNDAIAAAMQHSQQYMSQEELPASYMNQPSVPMSTYLEFPMSPQQWSSEALKSMNQEASSQQQNTDKNSQQAESTASTDESNKDNNSNLESAADSALRDSPTGSADGSATSQQQDINSQYEIINYDPNSGKSLYEQMEAASGGQGQGNGQSVDFMQHALGAESMAGHQLNPAMQQQQSQQSFVNQWAHHQDPSAAMRTPYSTPWVYNSMFNGHQAAIQPEGSLKSTLMASPSMNPLVMSGQQFAAGPFQSAGYVSNLQPSVYQNPLASPMPLMQPLIGNGGPTIIATSVKDTKKLAKAAGLMSGGSVLNPIGQTFGPAANNLTGGLAGFTSGLRNQMGAFQQRLPQMPNIPQPPQMPNLPMPPPGMMQMAGLALPFAMARATRNSNRIRNQQVNAAANGGGTTAGQRLIMSATQFANRLNRSRRKPNSSPGDPLMGSASGSGNRFQHPNRRPMMRFFQTVVDMTRHPPRRPKPVSTASRIATVAALTGGASKIKPKVDVSSSIISMVGHQPTKGRQRQGRSLDGESQSNWQNASYYSPGSVPVTITDGSIDQFSSMTSPVDLLVRQLESADRRRQQRDNVLREYHNSYEQQPAKPRLEVPLPLVANHINLLMFTAQNVTSDLLRSQAAQRQQQQQHAKPSNRTQEPPPAASEDDTSGYVIEPEAFIRVPTQVDDTRQQMNDQTAEVKRPEPQKATEMPFNINKQPTVDISDEPNIFRVEPEVARKPEYQQENEGQIIGHQQPVETPPTLAPHRDATQRVDELPFITTRLPLAASTFEGPLPSQLLPTTTTTTTITTTSTTPAPHYPTTIMITSSKPQAQDKKQKRYSSQRGSGKSRRSTVKPQELIVDNYQMAESRGGQFTPIKMPISQEKQQPTKATSSTTQRPSNQIVPKVNPTARSSELLIDHKTTATTKPPNKMSKKTNGSQNNEISSSEAMSADYVRAIKLVRGVAFPWPPPTKSSKVFGDLAGTTATAVMVV